MIDDPGEQAVIDGIHAAQPPLPEWIGTGTGDDGAVLGSDTVLTADAMVEGIHWDDRVSPEDVGFKLARSNLSASIGGWPGASAGCPSWGATPPARPVRSSPA